MRQYSYNHTKLEVIISAKEEEGNLVIKVENDGEQISKSHSKLLNKGMGLSNINDRLANLYRNEYVFEVWNRAHGGVETIVRLPKR